jgi:hypothetical protein
MRSWWTLVKAYVRAYIKNLGRELLESEHSRPIKKANDEGFRNVAATSQLDACELLSDQPKWNELF